MSQLDDITTKVTKLEGKVNSIETMSGKLDTTIEKLTDVSTSIKTMLVLYLHLRLFQNLLFVGQ